MPKVYLDSTAAGGEQKNSGSPSADSRDVSGGAPSPVMRAGFVALIGRPNVGKSTLLNRVLGEKLAIVSPKPQTTRTRLLGVKNLPQAQLALVDTPGMHRPDGRGRTLLNRYMVDEALGAVADVDVVLLMTDLDTQRAQKAAPPEPEPQGGDQLDEATRAVRALLHPADRYVVQQLGNCGKPLILAINKVDLLRDKKLLLPLIAEWNTLQNFRAIVPICAERGDGVDQLLEVLCASVPEGEALFPEDMLTDRAERFLVAELVREQVFLAAREELPYSVAVTIDGWEERIAPTGHRAGERIGVLIDATVHVEKANQKKIIVGEGGHMVRDLGIAARQAISELLGCGVHLSLFVRVDEEWTATPGGLRKMGYEAPNTLAPAKGTSRRPSPRLAEPPQLTSRAAPKSPPPHAESQTQRPPAQRTEDRKSKGASSRRAEDHKSSDAPSHRADDRSDRKPKGATPHHLDDHKSKDAPARPDDRKSKGSSPHRTDDHKSKGSSPHRADDRKPRGSSPHRTDDRKSKGSSPHRTDDRKPRGSSPHRTDDRKSKGSSPHRTDDRKSKGSSPHRADDRKAKGSSPQRSAETKFNGANKGPGPRPTAPTKEKGARPAAPSRHPLHPSYAGPGEHAK